MRNSLVRLAVSRLELRRRGGGETDFCRGNFLLGLPVYNNISGFWFSDVVVRSQIKALVLFHTEINPLYFI